MAVAVSLVLAGCTGTTEDHWADEFDGPAGSSADPSVWTNDVGNDQFDGWGNNELQWYTAGPANAALDGEGNLVITARDGTPAGPCHTVPLCPYTSARLTTRHRMEVESGRVEVRAKLPTDVGLLPAIWLLGPGEWPEGGEIDIAEVVGGEPTTIYGSAHGPGYSDDEGPSASTELAGDAADDFHVYAVNKRPDRVTWSVDGAEYASLRRTDIPADKRWVLDRPMAVVLNLAVGGTWPGDPDDSTSFPARMQVDYVRVAGDIKQPVDH
ncbi:glycoside hydrolase family 16 protein [Mycobacterium sp. ACS4331]|uniref:glycoside hydrolase family 16 protein n=1 Tax=Mycobacterium sp. ACS4331 TaxID=1834121 RepID=UPI001E40F1ED|nr:glycoside hydrolase family 16 protein [Mycobacterium sp. ACS4331]